MKQQIRALAFGACLMPFISPAAVTASELPDAETVLQKSIDYHDPDGVFLSSSLRLEMKETRPNGADRFSDVEIDIPGQRFMLSRRGEVPLTGVLEASDCQIKLGDNDHPSAEDLEPLGVTCQRLPRMRNYYTYLWGLPMKLRDSGTRLDPAVQRTQFQEQDVLGLRVTYDESVGGDIWYFYFDPETYALVGYRFYHDEAKNDGEYIVLEGEAKGAGIRLPKSRTWYTHQDERLLGTDSLEKLTFGPSR